MKAIAGILMVALLVWLGIGLVNHVSPAPTHAYSPERETRHCHDHGCRHYLNKRPAGPPSMLRRLAETAFHHNIRLLGQVPGLGYRQANLAIYVVLWPVLMALLTHMAIARLSRQPIWSRSLLLLALLLLSTVVLALLAVWRWPDRADSLLTWLYWYCTDFTVNLANLIGLSYAETNGLLFLVLFPLYTLTMLTLVLWPRLLPGTPPVR